VIPNSTWEDQRENAEFYTPAAWVQRLACGAISASAERFVDLLIIYFTVPPYDVLRSAYLSVCLYVCLYYLCPREYLINPTSKHHQLQVARDRCSVLLWRRCRTSGFVDDVIHAHSGGFNGWPHVQWPTRPLSKEAQEAPREVCSGGP